MGSQRVRHNWATNTHTHTHTHTHIFGCAGSLLLCGLPLVSSSKGYSWLQCMGFSRQVGSVVVAARLWLLQGMWNPTRPGIKPMSLHWLVTGRFLFTVPPGKSARAFIYLKKIFGGSLCKACGILVPQLGIKPRPPALEAQNFNNWKPPGRSQHVYFNESENLLPSTEISLQNFSLVCLQSVGPSLYHAGGWDSPMYHSGPCSVSGMFPCFGSMSHLWQLLSFYLKELWEC